MSNRPLSLRAFKNWITQQKDLTDFFDIGLGEGDSEDHIGQRVKPRVDEAKLLDRVETDGDAALLVQEFCESGGHVVAIDERRVEVEVESGSFTLPRFCVKIRKPD